METAARLSDANSEEKLATLSSGFAFLHGLLWVAAEMRRNGRKLHACMLRRKARNTLVRVCFSSRSFWVVAEICGNGHKLHAYMLRREARNTLVRVCFSSRSSWERGGIFCVASAILRMARFPKADKMFIFTNVLQIK